MANFMYKDDQGPEKQADGLCFCGHKESSHIPYPRSVASTICGIPECSCQMLNHVDADGIVGNRVAVKREFNEACIPPHPPQFICPQCKKRRQVHLRIDDDEETKKLLADNNWGGEIVTTCTPPHSRYYECPQCVPAKEKEDDEYYQRNVFLAVSKIVKDGDLFTIQIAKALREYADALDADTTATFGEHPLSSSGYRFKTSNGCDVQLIHWNGEGFVFTKKSDKESP